MEKKRTLISWKHIRDAIRVMIKKRSYNRRLYLNMSMVIFIMVITPIFGELNIRYLYVRTRYGWEVDEYSRYTTFDSSLSIIGKVIELPGIILS